MHPLQIGACNFKPPDHADDPPLVEIVHDRQGHEIVFDKQFLGSVEFVVGLERHYVPAHQILGQHEWLERLGLGGDVDLFEVDHSQQPLVGIHHGQNGVRRTSAAGREWLAVNR